MTKVAVLELVDEFKSFQAFIKEKELRLGDFEIVALSHKLQAHLRENDISYSDSLKYFDNEAQEKVLRKFDQLFRHIETTFSLTDEYGLTHAYRREVQHYTEIVFNYTGKLLSILESVRQANSDLELYVCGDALITDYPQVNDDRVLGLVAKKFAQTKKIKLVTWAGLKAPAERKPAGAGRRSSLYTACFAALKLYCGVFKKKIIALPTRGYGLQVLIDEISRRDQRVTFITLYDEPGEGWRKYLGILSGSVTNRFRVNLAWLGPDPSNKADVLSQLESIFRPARDVFELYGVDYSPIMKAKAIKSLSKHLRSISVWSVKLCALLKDLNIKLIISPFGRGIWAVAPELAKEFAVPSLFVSHGTHPVPTDRLHDIAIFNLCFGFMLGEYTHVALSTPVQEAHLHHYKERYPWIKNEEIKTGPLIFAQPSSRERSVIRKSLGLNHDDFVLLHAASIKWKGAERFHFLETIDEYLSSLSDVVDAVNAHDNYRLIIRLHPGFDLTAADLERFLPQSNKYILSDSGPFADVLSAADLLISYSSTCIDEALINRVPVLLYDKWNRYNHFNTGVFNDPGSDDIFPVCYVNDDSKLLKAIVFMDDRVDRGDMEKVDVSRYKYDRDYSENFYEFVAEQVNKEVTNEDSRPDSGKLVAR